MLVPKGNFDSSALPLQSLCLSCQVKDSLATLLVRHHFHNDLSNPIECSFKLPVAIDWVVSSLRIIKDDGTVLKALVKDKEEALEQYSDGISSGMSVFMGNTRGDREIELSLGNIAPQTGVRTELGMVFPLKCTGSAWLFKLPEWLQPSWEGPLNAVSVAQFGALPMERRKGVVGFSLEIHQSVPILSLTSTTHNLDVIYLDNQLKVNIALGTPLTASKGDICVEFHTSEDFSPKLQTQYDSVSGEYMGMLSFIPPLISPDESSAPLDAPGEYILIIDRSGSMWGHRIQMADEAAILFLKSLPPISKFNVISFGTQHVSMFPESRICDSEAVTYAVSQISTFTADMGENDVLNTLRGIYSRPADPAYPRSLYLLTDGGEPNHSEIVKYVEEYSKSTRVYSFGIATTRDSMDGWLITEIARVANGISIFINNPSEIGKSVISVLKQVMVSALANIAVEWPKDSYEQHPSNSLLKDCFLGELFTVFVNFGREPPAPGNVRVKAVRTDTKAELEMYVGLTAAFEPGDSVHKLWAKWAIKDLDLKHRQEANAEVVNRIKAVSKQYGVPSEHTSYLCVSENEVPITGALTSVTIQTGSRFQMNSGRLLMGGGLFGASMAFGASPSLGAGGLYGTPGSSGPVPNYSPQGSMAMGPPSMAYGFAGPKCGPSIMSKIGAPSGFQQGGLFYSSEMHAQPMGSSPMFGSRPAPYPSQPAYSAMPVPSPPPLGGLFYSSEMHAQPMGSSSMLGSRPAPYPSQPAYSAMPAIGSAMPSPPPLMSGFGAPKASFSVMSKPEFQQGGLFSSSPMPVQLQANSSMSTSLFDFHDVQSRPTALSNSPLSSSSFLDIITKQAASGMWPGSAYSELRSSRPSALTEDQWTTICVLILLKLKFKERAEESQLIVRKAVRALESGGVVIGQYEAAAIAALRL